MAPAISELLDNAIKWSPADAPVRVMTAQNIRRLMPGTTVQHAK